MAIEEAKIHFMRQHAQKGAKWIAESLELPLYDVVITASDHGISLRKPGERRGRTLNPSTAIRKAKEREAKAKRKAEQQELRKLDMNHPKVQLLLASNPNPDPKARLRTSHWKRQRKRVLERDAYTCTYCGDVANTVDHVVSRRAGGDDSMENLVAACMKCNASKGSVSGAVFLRRSFTPPVFIDNLSPKRSKPVQNGHTQSKILVDSPFTLDNSPDQSGAN